MEHSGQIFKMRVEHDDPVRYFLPIGDELPEISELIGEAEISTVSVVEIKRTSHFPRDFATIALLVCLRQQSVS